MGDRKKFLDYKWGLFVASRLAYGLNNLLCHSVKWKKVNYESVDSLLEDGGLIFLWHETIMASIYSSRNKGIYTISSTSRDSMLQEYILRKYKYGFVKGSSKHNGARALLGVLKGLGEGKSFAITCDGPSGPAYKCKPGAVTMLRKSGKKFICVGVALKDKWVFTHSWDNHQIPKFFTKGVLCFSDHLSVDENMTDEEILKYIEDNINIQKELASEELKKL
ncbi:MAG: DUF374 domain-containing protein [Armatimonadetes bacterium]|nr:DUF374 domain-containing protein [Candidatus Hippobium faecium]